jgi:hypothetical protein
VDLNLLGCHNQGKLAAGIFFEKGRQRQVYAVFMGEKGD